MPWSTEWIKACGVLPVYSLKHAKAFDGGSNINVEIVELKLKSKAQDIDESAWHFKNDIDDLQPGAIEDDLEIDDDFDCLLENDIDENENEEDQEQPSYSPKDEEKLCCSIGMNLFTYILNANYTLHISLFSNRKSLIVQMNNCFKFSRF
jgi:hypothetical protein